ncbi:Hypothetical predicted protein [Paramuricea clavata]|uniref:Uncharacterized protein n=1 Tax=Paramuricea clavata TaxID=317549 RepID=A0A6S7J9Q9_PARCT|nr:Hypothetical predicted protein [Paramuricea clavata]
MADEAEPEVAIQKIQKSDALFAELLQEFPTIYNQASKDFKAKNKKANCLRLLSSLTKL